MEWSVITGILATVWAILGSSWYSVVTHEWSHYFAGRVAGVPSADIRVRMRPQPPHVALRKEEHWLSPGDDEYVETFLIHQPKVGWAWFYIAAGTIGGSALVLMTGVALVSLGLDTMALVLLATSTVFDLIYIAGDAMLTRKRKEPSGDFSAMWQITPKGTIMLITVVLAIKVVAITIAVGFL